MGLHNGYSCYTGYSGSAVGRDVVSWIKVRFANWVGLKRRVLHSGKKSNLVEIVFEQEGHLELIAF